jgi:hypothetical protein
MHGSNIHDTAWINHLHVPQYPPSVKEIKIDVHVMILSTVTPAPADVGLHLDNEE